MMDILMIAAWTAFAAGIAAYAAIVSGQVAYVTLADGRRQERSIPFSFKLLLPFAVNFRKMFSSPKFAAKIEEADKKLVSAGFEGLIDGREFMALKILSPLVLGAVWCLAILMLGTVIPDSMFVSMRLELCIAGTVLLAVQPDLWLKQCIKRRHDSIMKSLPFVLDVLTLSVEAGMDFIHALQRNCASRKMDPLNEELLRMTKEIQVGSSRKAALKGMADRTGQSDLKAVARALVQADELGVSLGPILRILSDQMRARRFSRAEKLAGEAPTKMLGPLMLFIFPAVFIILLGPILAEAAKGIF